VVELNLARKRYSIHPRKIDGPLRRVPVQAQENKSMCPILRRPQSGRSRDVATTFRLRGSFSLTACICRLFRRKYLIFSLFSANRSLAHRTFNLVAQGNVFRALSFQMLTFTPQVPAFTNFTPKIFSPRTSNHFFAFGLWSFPFESISGNSSSPLVPNLRDFHAAKPHHFTLCNPHFAFIKPAWYRAFLLCTAKPNFFFQSTFGPSCHTPSAGSFRGITSAPT
jgi:hypothetical protein